MTPADALLCLTLVVWLNRCALSTSESINVMSGAVDILNCDTSWNYLVFQYHSRSWKVFWSPCQTSSTNKGRKSYWLVAFSQNLIYKHLCLLSNCY